MTIQNKRILASILFVLISFVCVAQVVETPPTPTSTSSSSNGPGLPGFPIDGGVLVGAFVALAYGASKKLKNKK